MKKYEHYSKALKITWSIVLRVQLWSSVAENASKNTFKMKTHKYLGTMDLFCIWPVISKIRIG